MTKCLLGFDIGGTKWAVILGRAEGEEMRIDQRIAFPTPKGPEPALLKPEATARELLTACGMQPEAIGIRLRARTFRAGAADAGPLWEHPLNLLHRARIARLRIAD